MSTIGEVPLLRGDLSLNLRNPLPHTWRTGIRLPHMFREKCRLFINRIASITAPGLGPKLHEDQRLSPVKHPARYRPTSAEILSILVSLGGRRGHAIRFTSRVSGLSTGSRFRPRWQFDSFAITTAISPTTTLPWMLLSRSRPKLVGYDSKAMSAYYTHVGAEALKRAFAMLQRSAWVQGSHSRSD